MKFGKQLRYECVSEWRSKYISYGKLKKFLRYLYKTDPKPPTQLQIQDETSTLNFSPNVSDPTNTDIKFSTINVAPPDKSNLSSSIQPVDDENNNNNERKPLLADQQHQLQSNQELSANSFNLGILKNSIEKEALFMSKIHEEVKKINEFFILKEKDIILHYNKLTEHCGMILKDRNPSPKVLKNLQKAFLELYKGLTMLENFVTLNYLGFCKILKKFDKFSNRNSRESNIELIQKELFYQSKSWKNMKEDVELLYCKIFKIDKIQTARTKLRPISESQSADYHMLKLGIAIGISLCSLVFIIVLFVSGPQGGYQPDWGRFVSVVPIFRGVGIPIVAVWLWGVNVYIWEKQRVNYILIFGLDPRTAVDHRRIFKTASFLTALWLGMFLLFCGTIMGNFPLLKIPAQVYPLVMVLLFLIIVLFPFRFFHRKSRLMLFITLGNVIMTPFGSTKFRALYLGDVLTSMVKTIFDWEYTACYFLTGDWEVNDGKRCNKVNQIALPIISGLPLLWRFMQCILRYRETKNKIHIGNSTKYAVGFSVVLFSALNGNYLNYPEPWTPSRILWCICFVLATMYMYVWDVLVDWGLMWLGKPRPLLRQSLMYKKYIFCYYYALFSNFIFRFAWTLTVTPIEFNIGINNELFVTILATVEIFRRMTWSVFRVENEHISNSLQYHAFDFTEAPWKDEIKKMNHGSITAPSSSKKELQGWDTLANGSTNNNSNTNTQNNGTTHINEKDLSKNVHSLDENLKEQHQQHQQQQTIVNRQPSGSVSSGSGGSGHIFNDPDLSNSSANWYNAASQYYSRDSLIDKNIQDIFHHNSSKDK